MSRAHWSEPVRHPGWTEQRYTLLVPGILHEVRPYHAGDAYQVGDEWRLTGYSYLLEPDAPRFTDREATRLRLLHDRLRFLSQEIERLQVEQAAVMAAITEEES